MAQDHDTDNAVQLEHQSVAYDTDHEVESDHGTAVIAAPTYDVSAAPPNEGAAQLQENVDEGLWEGSVTASRLKVRRGNSTDHAEVRLISRDDVVTVYEISEGWYRISQSSDAEAVEWVSGAYIQRVDQQAEPADVGDIPKVDMSGNGNSRAHNRWEDDGELTNYSEQYNERIDEFVANFFGEGKTRAQVMSDIDAAERAGRMDEATAMRQKLFLATQHAIADVLDVENNQLYQRGNGNTFCNIYAYDFVTAMGAYIPRVWWSEAAIGRIRNGEQVSPRYGETIFEMNANALTAWMPEYGVGYGWRKVTDMNQVQQEANSGKIAVLLAANANASRSGHITVVLSETEQEQKGREEGALPLSSQAGSTNHERHRPESAWWANSSHKDGAAWVYDGEIDSPIMTPQQMGLAGTKNEEKGLQKQIEKGKGLFAGNFMQAVERLEQLAADEGYTHVQTLSALRKLFYNSGAWNQAIPGAVDTGFPASWSTDENAALRDAVSDSQVVEINGVSVDVGHLLTGLDSTNYNTELDFSRAGIDIFSFRDNKEFSTYVGDIGSAVEAYIDERMDIEWLNLIDKNEEGLNRHYNQLAGDIDMAGNADSYAMQFDPTVSFSQNMRNYYSGENRGDDKRYTKFAEEIGLGSLEGGTFSNLDEDWKDAISSEISTFAQAYQMRNGAVEGITGWAGLIHYNKVANWMTDIFIERLMSKVRAENAAN